MAAALFRATTASTFDGLYRRHVASVYRYAFAVVGNQADAEDITQQTFLNAYRAMAQGTKPRKAENWLLTIAHNEVRRHFRDNQKKGQEVEFNEQLVPAAPERSDPGVADVLRALRHIPPAQRSALVMREFEGRSYAEIAAIMGLSERALETLIFRARRSLAEQLEGVLTCAEAEEAFMRRLDGRLPRREARRLRRHVKDCLRCARFGRVQKQQRSLLKGLSVMPVPTSIFLFRGETAAAAGGSASVAAGGAAVGVGAGGVATGLLAKAAAVTAAAVVAGGIGYEVATEPAAPVAKAEPKVSQRGEGSGAAKPAAVRPEVAAGARARFAAPSVKPKAARIKATHAKSTPGAAKAHRGKGIGAVGTPPGQAKAKAPTRAGVVRTRPAKATRPPKAHPVKQARPQKVRESKPVRVPQRPTKPKPAKPEPPAATQRVKPVRPVTPPPASPVGAVEPKKPDQAEKLTPD
jgi:RNA polymerase sigma factor (sigma-70 family)